MVADFQISISVPFRNQVKLKRISIVTLKEKTLELEHNQDKYTFCFYFFHIQLLKSLSMLSTFPLYIFLFIFKISFFLRDHNKAVQLFRANQVAIDFFNCFSKFYNYIVNNFFLYFEQCETQRPAAALYYDLQVSSNFYLKIFICPFCTLKTTFKTTLKKQQ